MANIKKDRRFWQVEDRVKGKIGSYHGFKDVPTDDGIEGRGMRIKFIPFRDVNNTFSAVPAQITNWFSRFFEVFEMETAVKDLGYKTLDKHVEIVNPDNSHEPGVPEKKVIIHADQYGNSTYNKSEELREKLHEKEQELEDLRQENEALDLDKREVEQQLDRDEVDGRKTRGNSRPGEAYHAEELRDFE